MNLSIHQVYESLNIDGAALITDDEILLNISGVRLWGGSEPRDDLLYIMHTNAHDRELPKNFICFGEPPQISTGTSAIALPADYDALDILSRTQDIFDCYSSWADEVNTAIIIGESLQRVLEIAAQYMKNPVALTDSVSTRLFASGETSGDPAAFATFTEAHDHPPSHYLTDGEEPELAAHVYRNSPPRYLHLSWQYSGTTLLRASVYVRNVYFGHLVTGNTDNPLTDGDYASMMQIRELMQNALEASQEFGSYVSETPQYFTKLIRGEPLKRSVVAYNLQQRKRKMDDSFFLWCFRPRKSIPSDRSIHEFLPGFNELLQNDMIFCIDDQVLCIDYNLDHHGNCEYTASLTPFIKTVQFDCAYSLVFKNIFELDSAYEQCRTTIEHADTSEPLVHSFRDSYRDYLTQIVETYTPFSRLLYPGLRTLLEENETYGAELLRCLQVYLSEGRNVSSTARRMFTHRHTVIYRLELVAKALSLRLDEIDSETMFHIIVSCELLLRNKSSGDIRRGSHSSSRRIN